MTAAAKKRAAKKSAANRAAPTADANAAAAKAEAQPERLHVMHGKSRNDPVTFGDLLDAGIIDAPEGR